MSGAGGDPEGTEPAHASRAGRRPPGCGVAWARFGTVAPGCVSVLRPLRLQLLEANGDEGRDHNRPNGMKGDCCENANSVLSLRYLRCCMCNLPGHRPRI